MNKILVFVLLQFVFFLPFYLIWKNDCKKIGKDNLAVSLEESFIGWLILFPVWILFLVD
jgi:hypothetical protein